VAKSNAIIRQSQPNGATLLSQIGNFYNVQRILLQTEKSSRDLKTSLFSASETSMTWAWNPPSKVAKMGLLIVRSAIASAA
jgi:hypothetical protein